MPKDQVPVYFQDQDSTWEKPGRGIVTREEARNLKALGLGQFFESGRKFRLHEVTPKPVLETWVPDGTEPPPVEGRNSCRKVGEYPDISYRVKHFSYPVPAWGARSRPQWCSDINEVPKVPVEMLAIGGDPLNQVQA